MMKLFGVMLFLALPLFAEPKDIVTWIGTTERVIPAGGESIVNLPITLRAALTAEPQIRQVTLLGEEIDVHAVKASWTGAALARKLTLRIDPKLTKKIGTYGAVLYIDTPDAASFTARTIEVKLVRRGPTLSIPTPLRAERVKYFFGNCATWNPEAWVVSETSGREDFAPPAKRWAVTLKKAETDPAGSLLYLDLLPIQPKLVVPAAKRSRKAAVPTTPPNDQTATATAATALPDSRVGQKGPTLPATASPAPTIPAGGQALLRPADVGACCPLGVVAGKFSLPEAQLGTPVEVSVEVTSRLWRGWLFVIIVLFISLGHFVRKALDARRALATAALGTGAILKDFDGLIKAVAGDPEFTKRGGAERNKVTEAMKSNDTTAITDAATAASTVITTLRTDYEKARKDASDAVYQLRGAIGDASAISGEIRRIADDVASQLDSIDASMAAGRVSGKLAEIKAVERNAVKSVHAVLPRWQAARAALIREMRSWADLDTTGLTQVSTRVEALKSDTIDDVRAVFSTAAYADANVKVQAPWFINEVTRLTRMIRKELDLTTGEPPPDLADRMFSDPGTAATHLQDLRNALKETLRDAVPEGKQRPQTIEESKFQQALDAVLALRAAQADDALGESDDDQHASGVEAVPKTRAQAAASLGPVAAGDAFSAEIEVNGEQIVGETLQLIFHVARDGAPVPNIEVHWWNGATYVDSGPTLSYTPFSTTSVVLIAKTTVNGQQISRTARISAASDLLFDSAHLRDVIKKVNGIQTCVAGAFITLIGYLIFEKAFVGTLVDWVTPALWGFASDITVAKVIEYAQPLMQRKPTFPV